MPIANVELDTTFDEWRVRTNQLIVQGEQIIFSVGDVYARTNGIFTNANTSYDVANAALLQANTARNQANVAYATANAALANTDGIVTAGALNVSGNLSVNSTLVITATDDVSEGGQLVINGSGNSDNWTVDSFQNNLRVFTNSSNVNTFTVTNNGANGTVNMTVKGHATVASMNVVPNIQLAHNQANTSRSHANAAFGQANVAYGQANSAIAATAALLPSGTVMLFVQSTAPTGWTKSTAHDNKALRVVSGSAGSGGTVGFTTAFSNKTVSTTTSATGISGTTGTTGVAAYTDYRQVSGAVQYHTLSWNEMPYHEHFSFNGINATGTLNSGNFPNYQANPGNNNDYTIYGNVAGADRGRTSGAGSSWGHNHGFVGDYHQHYFDAGGHAHSFNAGSHSHTFSTNVDLTVQYVDVIIATKN